jgi:hypothetical protein
MSKELEAAFLVVPQPRRQSTDRARVRGNGAPDAERYPVSRAAGDMDASGSGARCAVRRAAASSPA